MLRKSIKYIDYNGVERNETFYFNLNRAELLEMELTTDGGMTERMEKIVAAKNSPELFRLFKGIIMKAYGEKTADGKRLAKSEDISTAFSQTEAYNQLLAELLFDAKAAADFCNAIIPSIPESNSTTVPFPTNN